MSNNTVKKEAGKNKFASKIIAASIILVSTLLLIVVLGTVIANLTNKGTDEEITVDPSKLAETKEEGFDIMEYDEYLNLNRVIMFSDKNSGVAYSVDESNYKGVGADVELVYELINAVISGDSNTYNSFINDESKYIDCFTQQQIYDVEISRQSEEFINNEGKVYTEYVVILTYKIHENNGSFRKDIESDVSKPQYLVINNSTGEYKVMDIVYVRYSY